MDRRSAGEVRARTYFTRASRQVEVIEGHQPGTDQ